MSLLADFKEFNNSSWGIMHQSLTKNIAKKLERKKRKSNTTGYQSQEISEFTTSRQLLAIYYLLNYSQVEFALIDRTELARFAQLLTGRGQGAKKIQDTNLYKKLGSLFHDSEKRNRKDLQFIKGYFERIGLTEIVRAIENDMSEGEI